MTYICTICSDSLETSDEKPATIPCGHTFHKTCLLKWIEVATKCPICSKHAEKRQVIAPLYFSTDLEITGDSLDTEALLRVANIKQMEAQEALKDSRIANKYYQEELEKHKAMVTRISSSVAESTKKHIRETKATKLELKKKDAELKQKDAELRMIGTELKKKIAELELKDAEINRLKGGLGLSEDLNDISTRQFITPKKLSYSRFNFGSPTNNQTENKGLSSSRPFGTSFFDIPAKRTTKNKEPVLPPALSKTPVLKKENFLFGSPANNKEPGLLFAFSNTPAQKKDDHPFHFGMFAKNNELQPQFTFNFPKNTQTKLNIPARRLPSAGPPNLAHRNNFSDPPNLAHRNNFSDPRPQPPT